MPKPRLFMIAGLVFAAAVLTIVPGWAAPGITIRMSVSSSGDQASGDSLGPSLSWTGGAAAFSSGAPDLVAGDTNGAWDVFRRDLLVTPTTVTERVDLVGTSGQATDGAYSVAVAAARVTPTASEGRYVAFVSRSTDLGATAGFSQVFVRDRQNNTTIMVSVDSSSPNPVPGNGDSFSPWISWDGRYVAFASQATNLGSGDTNAATDIFVRDWLGSSPATIAVSSPSGALADGDSFSPAISPDGRYVAFQSNATNLVVGDTNGFSDVFVRDLQAATTRLISRGAGGVPANGNSGSPAINDGGSYVAFASAASNLLLAGQDTNGATDIFLATNADPPVTTRVSVSSGGQQSNGDSLAPAISADARYVAFQSAASNLVTDDTNNAWDVFVRDRIESPPLTYRVSIDTSGSQANGASTSPVLSADGRYVGFESSATALVSGDTNGAWDIFRQDTDADGDGYSDALEQSLGNPSVYCAIMRADVNGDHVVSTLDFGAVAGKFGQAVPPANPRLDQNGDNKINMLDLGAMSPLSGQNISACP